MVLMIIYHLDNRRSYTKYNVKIVSIFSNVPNHRVYDPLPFSQISSTYSNPNKYSNLIFTKDILDEYNRLERSGCNNNYDGDSNHSNIDDHDSSNILNSNSLIFDENDNEIYDIVEDTIILFQFEISFIAVAG
ncbi:hypothetical protein ACTFIW_005097 [Dictyostelium discoideum]